MMVIQAKNLSKSVSYQDETLVILRQVSLQVKEGESIAILGASGSGKSTLLSLLAGLDEPSEGSIDLLGHPLKGMTEDQRTLLRQQIGFVFQQYFLLPQFSALENVMLPCEIAQVRDAKSRASEALKAVGLEHRLNHYPSTLSGGEQQRVALARAFVTQPSLILADEPTGSLDEKTGNEVIDKLFQLNEKFKTTLVIVTHDPNIAERTKTQYQLKHGTLCL